MALLISPNMYQPSNHYLASLIMQDPCVHQASFEQSLTKCPCESCVSNLTQILNFSTPTWYSSYTLVGMFIIWNSTNIRFGQKPHFLRRTLVLLVLLGLQSVLCGPVISGFWIGFSSHSKDTTSRAEPPCNFFSQLQEHVQVKSV